ncbi:MAG TPA: DUF6320 domain-containing protein [Bacteroidales bacterium]|nr:DUF6320 domain-containing protein [Bacteroidales bacterium]
MIICLNCGVELDDGLIVCPLCGKDPLVKGIQKDNTINYPSEIVQLHTKEIRKYLWELSGIITFSAVMVCTLVDLIISKSLGWSLISDVFVIGGWITFTLFMRSYRKVAVLFPGLLFTVLSALFIIDILGKGENWFLPLGLPLTIAFFAAAGIVRVLFRIAHFKGLNIIAAALLVLSGFCVVCETIIDRYLYGSILLRWSLIAAISIIPLSFLLLFYHYRLKKGNLLDSFFHV